MQKIGSEVLFLRKREKLSGNPFKGKEIGSIGISNVNFEKKLILPFNFSLNKKKSLLHCQSAAFQMLEEFFLIYINCWHLILQLQR